MAYWLASMANPMLGARNENSQRIYIALWPHHVLYTIHIYTFWHVQRNPVLLLL